MFRSKTMVAVICGLCAIVVHAQTPRLTLDDIDQLSRDKVVKTLKDAAATTPAPGPSNMSAPQSMIVAPAPASAPAPVRAEPKQAERPRVHLDPVTFVGAFTDATGSHVLYEFDGAVYPAHVGEQLLNGATARKVNGFLVTVTEGRRTWTQPIRSSAAPASVVSGPLQALNDLGGPLPPGGFGGAPTTIQMGR
ncbi:hypothetical protein [Paraburkholderia phenazinium]|uniref:hypothetical protein n=1 Tax=Paraburkholderia phenazinium TaxID=60549 RepID=UPI00158BF87E|nr:hypothetical protein [Paraburkholderia phenazinium]